MIRSCSSSSTKARSWASAAVPASHVRESTAQYLAHRLSPPLQLTPPTLDLYHVQYPAVLSVSFHFCVLEVESSQEGTGAGCRESQGEKEERGGEEEEEEKKKRKKKKESSERRIA